MWASNGALVALLCLATAAAQNSSASSTPPPPPAQHSGGISVGVLVGILVGVLVFIVLKTTCIIYVCRRRQQRLRDPTKGSRILNARKAAKKGALSGPEVWEMDVSDVEILRYEDGTEVELGSGGFGRVFHGIRAGVQDVAIKTVVQADIKAEADFLREINMLKFVSRDRNIVQFYGACRRNTQLWLITEYMEGGDLRQALTASGKERVTWWRQGKLIALDMARGLAFLHANNVIHRDLKSKNILLTKGGLAKIGDVGMAKVMSDGTMTHDAVIGTFAWASPELLLGERCSEKVDVYSLGVVLWEICTGELPVRGAIETPSPENAPPEVSAIIFDCMKRDPKLRPSALEVYQRLRKCEPLEIKASILDSDGSEVADLPFAIKTTVDDDSAGVLSQLRRKSTGDDRITPLGTYLAPKATPGDDQGGMERYDSAMAESITSQDSSDGMAKAAHNNELVLNLDNLESEKQDRFSFSVESLCSSEQDTNDLHAAGRGDNNV